MNWMQNGAVPTLNALHALRKRDPEVLFDLLDYLKDAPLYDTATAGGRDFLLVHSGLGHFRRDKRLSDYEAHDLMPRSKHPKAASEEACEASKELKPACWKREKTCSRNRMDACD